MHFRILRSAVDSTKRGWVGLLQSFVVRVQSWVLPLERQLLARQRAHQSAEPDRPLQKLRFDLHKAHSDSWYYAEYHTFTVSGEAYNYQLHVSGYTGDTGYDALKSHDGMMFTTWDRDNDPWTKPQYNNNCAVFNGGGFWWTSYLGYCGGCDVNAVRDSGEDFSWDLERGQLKLQTSRMWLQCKYPLSHHSK